MEIITPRCTVRSFRTDDAESVVQYVNNRTIWLNLRDVVPHPYRRADADAYIRMAMDATPTTVFAVDMAGKAVGSIALVPGSDTGRRTAEIGYWLGEPFWGRGIMSDAVAAVTQHAFDALDMLRVFAVPLAHNRASARVLQRAGYLLEGTMRCSAIKDGVLHDQLLYAKVRE